MEPIRKAYSACSKDIAYNTHKSISIPFVIAYLYIYNEIYSFKRCVSSSLWRKKWVCVCVQVYAHRVFVCVHMPWKLTFVSTTKKNMRFAHFICCCCCCCCFAFEFFFLFFIFSNKNMKVVAHNDVINDVIRHRERAIYMCAECIHITTPLLNLNVYKNVKRTWRHSNGWSLMTSPFDGFTFYLDTIHYIILFYCCFCCCCYCYCRLFATLAHSHKQHFKIFNPWIFGIRWEWQAS